MIFFKNKIYHIFSSCSIVLLPTFINYLHLFHEKEKSIFCLRLDTMSIGIQSHHSLLKNKIKYGRLYKHVLSK